MYNLRLAATCEVRTRMSLESSCVLAFVIENDSVSMCPSRSRLIARLYTSLGVRVGAVCVCVGAVCRCRCCVCAGVGALCVQV